jgi:hypothetical protein
MKKRTFIMANLLIICLLFSFNLNAQKLGAFNSAVTKKLGPKTVAVPYTDVISYLGFAELNSQDAIVDGKKFYYVYVWIPAVAPELGVRMISPVPAEEKLESPIVAPNYESNKASKDYFDTYITFEKSNILSTDKISTEAVKSATWTTLEKNDDSGELPKQPSGSAYNSLLRYTSQPNDPLKALTIGLYRVGFTTYKVGEVKGTFLAQVGAPVKLPGVAIAKTIDDLKKQLVK